MGAPGSTHTLWGQARDFLLGAALAGLAAALLWQFYPGFWKDPPQVVRTAPVQPPTTLEDRQQHLAVPATMDRAVAARGPCDLEPLVRPTSTRDGQLRMEHPFPAGPRAKAKVFMRMAEGAAADGRARDLEVALIASCRYDLEATTAPTVPLARVLGLLGAHYQAVGATEASADLREQFLARARDALELSAATYAKALGPNAQRSRAARQRIDRFEDDLLALSDAPQPDLRDKPVGSAQKTRAQPQIVRSASREAPAARVSEPRPAPRSAAPASAGSQHRLPEPLAREHPELRQLAADLMRLRAQAEAVSDDLEGLRRRAALAQARRAQCKDAECLRSWYAQRRKELLEEF